MIKAKFKNTIVFGLSDENLHRLKEGQPIKFNLKELGLQDMAVLIFNGKNEDEMQAMFKDMIHPEKTIYLDHRKTKDN